jgi:hypothetical protein
MSQLAHQSLRWDPSKLHFEFPLPDKESRLKELVIYISDECLDDPTYSRTKLYKILFYSEFESYGRFGAPITGTSYKKMPFGPAPASYKRIQDEMLREHLIRIVQKKVYDHARQRLLPLRDPNFELFSARDISIVSGWIRFFWNKSPKEVSKYSHGKAWSLADEGELIPYEAVFISDDPVTYDDVARVRELASQHGWKL